MNAFFALTARMKLINRWSLMRNTNAENLSEHCAETAVIAHALATLGNVRLHQNYSADRLAVAALYHDLPEILTGDLPTPVKYGNRAIHDAYKAIEADSMARILAELPSDLRPAYAEILTSQTLTEEEKRLLKAADKISALLKCIEEEKAGNHEFTDAKQSTEKRIHEMNVPEAELFLREFLPAYGKTLDEALKSGTTP